MLLPLAGEKSLNIMKELSSFATGDMAASFAAVGKGIGAIMLLIVALYYITSILDGGKFQLKMLLPLLIFILVCNFSWVSGPVVSFTQTITSSLVATCESKKNSIKAKNGCLDSANINDLNNAKMEGGNDGKQVDYLIGKSDDRAKDKSDTEEVDQKQFKNKRGGGLMARAVHRGSTTAANQASYNFQRETSGETYQDAQEEGSGKSLKQQNITWQGIISSVVSWVCQIMSKVLEAFGAVMTGIIIAFGPITFAFAVFPGQGRNILSWFLRLCQFSLWAPIVALIDTFSVMIFDTLATTSFTAGSLAMAIAVAVCNLVALTSVPTIASMIIEGAQGAVSLSAGLQSIGSALTGAGAVVGGIGSGAATVAIGNSGKQYVKDTVSGLKERGAFGAMKDIYQHSGAGNTFKGLSDRFAVQGRKARRDIGR